MSLLLLSLPRTCHKINNSYIKVRFIIRFSSSVPPNPGISPVLTLRKTTAHQVLFKESETTLKIGGSCEHLFFCLSGSCALILFSSPVFHFISLVTYLKVNLDSCHVFKNSYWFVCVSLWVFVAYKWKMYNSVITESRGNRLKSWYYTLKIHNQFRVMLTV